MKFLSHIKKTPLTERMKYGIQLFLLITVFLCIYGASWIHDPSTCPFCGKFSQGIHFSSFLGWFSPSAKLEGYIPVGFNVLSGYNYNPSTLTKVSSTSASSNGDSIPPSIKALNGKKVILQGYVVPVVVMDGQAKSFMLVRSTMLCCFGITPKMNEWVDVEMNNDKIAKYRMDVPTNVYGTFEVGENYIDGTLMSIYRLKADSVAEANTQ